MIKKIYRNRKKENSIDEEIKNSTRRVHEFWNTIKVNHFNNNVFYF